MAKGNMLQGQATGKVGDIVFMVRNGQQVARVYTSAGGRSGDQASIAVRRQRVRFGAASNQYLLYRNIVRGMYRTGKSTKQSDYNFFVRENVDLLPYLTKDENAAGVKCAMPGTFSRGTLGSLNLTLKQEIDDDTNDMILSLKTPYQLTGGITSNDTVGELKAALRASFPNARKVSIAFCFVLKQELTLPSGSQWTHTFDRQDIVFDLYEEDPNVADTDPVNAYISYYCSNPYISNIAVAGNISFCEDFDVISLRGVDSDQKTALTDLYLLAFAANDQVGDCYTTTLDSMDVLNSDGGLDLYESLRTDNHKQVAEDSYGYATGVMRTNIQQA